MENNRLERLKNKFHEAAEVDKWRVHEEIAAYFHDIGDAEGAAQSSFNAALCDKYLRSQRSHYSNYLFTLHYLSGLDNETLAAEHFKYADLFAEVEYLPLKHLTSDKITIGYLAPHFLESSSARFYEALLTDYDATKFKIKCFSLSEDCDAFTEKIKSGIEKFITLTEISIEESAHKIFDEDVDILFDLGGHTDGGLTLQIMSYKPAPMQISGIGYFDTTALPMIDYFLTDNYLAPIGTERFFTEKLLRLNSAFAFKPSNSMRKAQCGMRNDFDSINFGCFNNFMKLTDEYLKLLKKILRQVDGSRLIMQDTTAIPARKAEMKRRLKNLKLPLDKIEIRLGNDNYLDDYSEVDIMLDTFPYNGGTMTATALYMNVPVISIYGSRHSSRFGADILRLAGLTDLIALNEREYERLAVELAGDKGRLINLKTTLRDKLKASKLLDSAGFLRELESFYNVECGIRN